MGRCRLVNLIFNIKINRLVQASFQRGEALTQKERREKEKNLSVQDTPMMENGGCLAKGEIMRRKLLILFAMVVLVFCFSQAAIATSVNVETVDPNTNTITDPDGSNAKETIYNIDPWQKYVTFSEFTPNNDGEVDFKMTWQITNQTGYTWADYLFDIITQPDFTYDDTDYPISVSFHSPASSADFKGVVLDPTSLTFFYDPPGSKYIEDNEILNCQFNILMTGFPQPLAQNESFTYTFIIEQRPSLVPIPGAVLLLGAGLARLVAYARRRQD